MAEQKIKSITIGVKEASFISLFSKLKSGKTPNLSELRQLLSNEKAKLLHVTKTKKPESIYKLSKLLGRDFKAVRHDIKILEKFGFIELISEIKNGRERLMPIVDADQVQITINL